MANITISSLNVRGLGNNKKRRETFQWLREKNYSIYMLQEVHCTEKSFEPWAAEWGYTALFSGLATNKAGVAILFNNNFTDGKPVMYKAWLKKGIIHIKDLINEDSKFLSLTDLKAKFNLEVPFTVYYGLVKAILARWKENIQNTDVAPSEVVPSLLLPSTKIAY